MTSEDRRRAFRPCFIEDTRTHPGSRVGSCLCPARSVSARYGKAEKWFVTERGKSEIELIGEDSGQREKPFSWGQRGAQWVRELGALAAADQRSSGTAFVATLF